MATNNTVNQYMPNEWLVVNYKYSVETHRILEVRDIMLHEIRGHASETSQTQENITGSLTCGIKANRGKKTVKYLEIENWEIYLEVTKRQTYRTKQFKDLCTTWELQF